MKKYSKLFIIFISLVFILIQSGQVLADFNLTYDINRGLRHPKYKLDNVDYKFFIPEFHVKGIYVTGWAAGSKRMDDLIDLVDNSIVNAMVIDIKDQDGFLSYVSSVPLAKEIKANKRKIKNIQGLVRKLKSKGIYTIARISVFKDLLLSRQKQELALQIHNKVTKETYRSKNWLDPSKKEVWDYNINLAREAARFGFDEIQFDYIRYPALGKTDLQALVPGDKNKSVYINKFAQYVSDELANLDIKLSTDVFGLTTTVEGDLGIGQDFAKLSNIINIISPMVYPSHYSEGLYGLKIPELEPYNLIYHSLSDAKEKVIANDNVKIRPWLQDFSLTYHYGYKEVMEQIKAVEKLGIKEWLLWNPSSRYTKEALNNRHYK